MRVYVELGAYVRVPDDCLGSSETLEVELARRLGGEELTLSHGEAEPPPDIHLIQAKDGIWRS